MYALALAGLLGLRRCAAVICMRGVQNTVFYRVLCAWKIQNLDSGEMQKIVGFRRVVSAMRAARTTGHYRGVC